MKLHLFYTIMRLLFVGILICAPFVSAQSQSTHKQARQAIINNDMSRAVTSYGRLIKGNPKNTTLLIEYAYALALADMPNAALMYLDRVHILGSDPKVNFYMAQVLSLMGHDDLSKACWTPASTITAPEWIAPHYVAILAQYRKKSTINRDPVDKAFARSNQLAAQGMYLQSLVLYQEIKAEYPEAFLPYLGSSVVWGKMKVYNMASNDLETAITRIQDQLLQTKDTVLQGSLPAFEQHLAELKQRSGTEPAASFLSSFMDNYHPRTMVYAGGMFASSYYSFNSQFGVFLSNSFNAAVNLGLSGGGGTTSLNLGLSAYQRYKIFAGGLGISGQFGQGTSFSINPSIGFSFWSSRKNRSTDIFLTTFIPFTNGAKPIIGISFGQSFYFGKR